jgi:DNA-directed RNA polymerase specialized sigma24 family protein
MSLDEEYTAYVTGRLTWLRQIAYPLCHDWHRADDLVQTAITRLYVKWRQARLADNLDAYVRTILIRVFLAEQTARALGCSTGTVKSQTARGLATLRSLLGAQDFRLSHTEER